MIKNILYVTVLIFAFLFINTNLIFAQCAQGEDDDGDGLLNEYDSDCCNNPILDVFYDPCVNSTCVFTGSSDNIHLNTKWESQDSSYRTFCVPVFGDLDGDGIPEIVVDRFSADGNIFIDIIDGATGLVEQTLELDNTGDNRTGAIAIGDILSGTIGGQDGIPEIVVSVGAGRLHILRQVNGNYLIHETVDNLDLPGAFTIQNGPNGIDLNMTLTPNLADFDGDGIPEIYCGHFIVDPASGLIMNTMPINTGLGQGRNTNGGGEIVYTVAADVDASSLGLELVAGNTVYAVVINRTNTPQAILDTLRTVDANDGFTSLADWDNDGDLDAIITTTITTPQGVDQSQLYIWDLQSRNILKQINVTIPASGVLGNYSQGTGAAGRANLGDLDGDGEIEAVFCHNYGLVAIDRDTSGNLIPMWTDALPNGMVFPFVITSDDSGVTGTTMFDFDANGTMEVVYRDETNLRILEGATGRNISTIACPSATALEHPVVGDIDNNGTTELLTICDIDNDFGTIDGTLIAFEPTNIAWAPSRPVWNQSNYFYTNINDDLSIPSTQQNHHVVAGLNSYINQYADTLASIADATGRILSTQCLPDGQNIQIRFEVTNQGDNVLSSTMPISIYDTDPSMASAAMPASLVATNPNTLTLGQNLNPGESRTITFTVNVADWQAQYFILLNDNGASASNPNNFPYDFSQPLSTNIPECDYTNNLLTVGNPSCCFAEDNADYLQIAPNVGGFRFTIQSGYVVWPDKVFIPAGVVVQVSGQATLDITNADIVFGEDAEIQILGECHLVAYNSVFRPCNDNDTWKGIRFFSLSGSPNGSIKESTFINAERAVSVVESIRALGEVELKNNLFSNCYTGVYVNSRGVELEPNFQISGNTFEWGDWEHINYDLLPSTLEFSGIHMNFAREFEEINYQHPIAQNDFINNTNYNNIAGDHQFRGVFVENIGGASMAFSNNTFSNLDHAFSLRAFNRNINPPTVTIENNFIEVMRRSNRDLSYQIMFTRYNINHSCIAHISNNTIINSAIFDATTLDPRVTTTMQPSNGINNPLIGTGAIYTNNNAHIVDNEILGFEVGIFADDVVTGNSNGVYRRIANNEIESYIYGIYRRGFDRRVNADDLHTVINCNTIDMKLAQPNTLNSVGICYEINAPLQALVDQERFGRGHIENNCVSNANIAIQLINNRVETGGSGVLPVIPFVRSNFLHNYFNIGLEIINFENTDMTAQRIHKNTFYGNNTSASNNTGSGLMLDIVHDIDLALPQRALVVNNNDFAGNQILGASGNINNQHMAIEPSSAACANQDAGKTSIILGIDCHDESVVGVTNIPLMAIASNNNSVDPIGNTTPSSLPFPTLRNYEIVEQNDLNQASIGQLQLFPNPTNSNITLKFEDLLEGDKVIQIYNAQGQLVKTSSFAGQPYQYTVSVEDLTAGIYELILVDQRGLAASATFVRQ